MNMRALPSVALRVARDPWPARLVPVAPGLAAVLFDTPAGPARASRLTATVDGGSPPRPCLSTTLDLRSGQRRHVLLLGLDAAEVARRHVTLGAGAEQAVIDPAWLRSPLARADALTGGLTETGANRLIRLVLTACAALPGAEEARDRVTAVLDLIDVARAPCRMALPLGAAGTFLVYRLPGTLGAEDLGDMLLPGAGPGLDPRLRRHVEIRDKGGDIFLFLPGRAPEIGVLCLGTRQLLLAAPEPAMTPSPIVAFLHRMPATVRAWAETVIAAEAPGDETAAAALRELRYGGPAPTATVRHLSATPAGVLLALDMADPARLLSGARVERGGAAVTLPIPEGAQLAAFAPLPGTGPVTVRLVHRSGRMRLAHSAEAPFYRGEAPAAFPRGAADALARARLSLPLRRTASRIAEHNAAAMPRFALVAPVSPNLDTILARAALLAGEPGAARVETVYHVAAGPLADAAEAAIAEAARIFPSPIRLLTLRADTMPTERLRAALGEVRAPRLALLGAEVMPGAPGWLADFARGLGGDAPRLRAGLLTGPDGAVLHAGGCDAALGLPAELSRPRGVTAISADCALMNRAAAEGFLGLTSAYPNPDILLTLLARRLGAAGHPARVARGARFIRYAEPSRPDPLEAAVDAAALAAAEQAERVKGIGSFEP